MSDIIIKGDTSLITFTLLKDGSSFVISPTSTVQVRFYESNELNTVLDTIDAIDSEDGADWPNSTVTIKISVTTTIQLTVDAHLEPRVTIVDDNSERITYTGEVLDVLVVKEGF